MPNAFFTTHCFKALTDEWTYEELGRFFWLVPKDIQEVGPVAGSQLARLRTESVASSLFARTTLSPGHPDQNI